MALLGALPLAAQAPSQPLPMRDASLLGLAFLQLEPASPRLLPQGSWEMTFDVTAGNTFARSSELAVALLGRPRGAITLEELRRTAPASPLFLFDGETYLATLRLRRGLPGGYQFDVQLPLVTQRGGTLDGHIDVFHGLFGIDDAGRNEQVRGAYLVYLRSSRGELFVDRNPGTGLGDVVVALGRGLPSLGATSEIALRVALKLPTGREDELQSTGSPDLGLQLLASRRLGFLLLSGSLSASYLGAWDRLALDPQPGWTATICAEAPLGRSAAAIAQLSAFRSPLSQFGHDELRPPLFQFALGLRRRLPRDASLSASLVENVLFFDNGADIALYVGLRQPF